MAFLKLFLSNSSFYLHSWCNSSTISITTLLSVVASSGVPWISGSCKLFHGAKSFHCSPVFFGKNNMWSNALKESQLCRREQQTQPQLNSSQRVLEKCYPFWPHGHRMPVLLKIYISPALWMSLLFKNCHSWMYMLDFTLSRALSVEISNLLSSTLCCHPVLNRGQCQICS